MIQKWLLAELKYAGQEHLDDAYVAGYDPKAQFDPTDDINALVQLGLSKASTVIDFGAGSGTFALAIAPLCRSVIAIDPTPAMNQRLQHAAAHARITNLIQVNRGFLTYHHDSQTLGPVDFIFTRNALHHLPDFWKALALARLHTLLAPNGILRVKDLIYDFNPGQADAKLEAWMAGAVVDSSAGWTADELAEHVRLEHSTFSWLFEPMLARAGFDILERAYGRGVYGTYTCRARSERAFGKAERQIRSSNV